MGHRGGDTTCNTPLRPSTETNYRGQNVEADVCGFSLPGFWLRKSESILVQGTGDLVAPPYLSKYLAHIARLYHGVEAISCQAQRNFSSLSFLIDTLRASMSPLKVEQMMFLKLNQGCLFKSTTPSLLRCKKDAANASRMCNRHKRRLLGRRWM